jgi:WD40 repeat protein
LVAELAEQTDEVRTFAFSPSGRLLLACNQRGNLARLWTIDTNGPTPICELRGIYNTHYPISTAFWLGEREFMLADTGDTSCRPSFYQVWVENLT